MIREKENSADIVEKRLHRFINKYYRVRLIQGIVATLSAGLILFLFLLAIGNILRVESGLLDIIKIVCFVVLIIVFAIFIVKPVAQRLGFLGGLNFKDASRIIQEKHKSVEDRIINIIELTREKVGQNNILYDHAIAQKTENVQDIRFDDAISFRKIGVFTIRLILLIVLCTGTVWLWPDFVKRGMGAIRYGIEKSGNYSTVEFIIKNDSLQVESGKDFLLKFQVRSALPVEETGVQIGTVGENALLAGDSYEYLFQAVNSPVFFRLTCNGMLSGEYELKTLQKPEISGLQLKVFPPAYTGLEGTVTDGNGNAEVAVGSRVIWTVRTVNTDRVIFAGEGDSAELRHSNKTWNFEKEISAKYGYKISCINKNGLFIDYFYAITIVKDLFPLIDISESRDSSITDEIFIQGIIQDDYGFERLEIIEKKLGKETVKEIKINKSIIYENFYYTITGDSIDAEYYFRVWDNDRFSGPKFTDSRKISIKTRSREEIENVNSLLADSIKTSMAEGMNVIDKMEKKISLFRIDQILGNLKPWEIQEKMKELNDLKKEVVDFLNNIEKTDKEFTENEQLLNKDDDLMEKAKQIKDLMENLLDDEMKELLKQFEDLAKEFNSRKAEDVTEKMETNLEKLKQQMEMSLELLKKYDMEKDLIKQAEKLNQMADSLQEEKPGQDSIAKNLKEEFSKWEKEYDNRLKENKQFKEPMKLDSLGKEREDVRGAADDLGKKNDEKSGAESRRKAAEGLKKLAKKMNDMLGSMNGESEFVDLEDLRQIRNSLNDFSKKQEDLNNRISGLNLVNPVFTSVIKEQKELESKFISVRDSLISLGYKQPVITKVIGSELFHVETSMKNLFGSTSGNRANVIRIEQNKIMTEVNSIAVKLDELIRSIENAKGKGSGNKGFMDRKKPKDAESKGSEKLSETKSMQQSLKEQLKNSIQKMKSGNTGKKERGEMARMLGEREMMRKALEQLLQGGGLGKDAKNKANEALNMMKEVEKDIIYNRLSDRTMEKDNLIRTKLLEAENAEKERENENRRESKEFKGSFEPNRQELEKMIEQNKALEQTLKYNELKLKRFYQEKYQKYIESTKK